jgi:hypothetical protein
MLLTAPVWLAAIQRRHHSCLGLLHPAKGKRPACARRCADDIYRLLRRRLVILSGESRRLAGILLVVFPTVIYGGVSLLLFLSAGDPVTWKIPCVRICLGQARTRRSITRSIARWLRYVDEAKLSSRWKAVVRSGIPSAAILLPAGFFLSIAPAEATAPNALIYLAFAGAVVLAIALITLGVGLVRGGH